MNDDVEQVYVVPRATLLRDGGWRGLRTTGIGPLLETIRTGGAFIPRPEAERDPAFKQIIPYLVLRDGSRYFLMRRTRAGGDPRLHERCSIGVGGHLNPGDGDLEGGLRREWREELVAGFVPDFGLIGLLNDDDSDVGSVHLGVVFVADAAGRPVQVRETAKLGGAFVDPGDVEAARERLETWSALVFDVMEGPALAGRRP